MAYVLRDKTDALKGLAPNNAESKQITTYQHIIQIDSRDCVGLESLRNAQILFEEKGGRNEASGFITSVKNTYPIKIGTSTSSVSDGKLRNGDMVEISGVYGNTAANGLWRVMNLTVPDPTMLPYSSFEISSTSNGAYASGGLWIRSADNGYPTITTNTSVITKNEMNIVLQKKLKAIRSIALNVSIIPRDIIPIMSYYPDLASCQLYYSPITQYPSFIPQEQDFIEQNAYGFYTTNIGIFRSYTGKFSMPNQTTPPPLKLWNPPIGAWPNQPVPYPGQTVPTYRSGDITIDGEIYYLVASGYGVYDLLDWTKSTRSETEKSRKELLNIIIRSQTLRKMTKEKLIENCSTTSSGIYPFGYGQFQRFVCGPGLQLEYQPGTSDGANPSIVGPDWPIAFPNFLGNVWGPYDAPGDRFQKVGLVDTLQDLFLNGDLDNLFGRPIISPALVPLVIDQLEGITFGNIEQSTNPNILNAMRIVPNGFGAAKVLAVGNGITASVAYQSSGGIGPSSLGAPSAWSLTGVYGAPSIDDPNAVGPLSGNLLVNGTIPQTSVGNLPAGYPAQTSSVNHRISWYDRGASNGQFKEQVRSYILYACNNLPSAGLVIQVDQFPRDERVQSTNSEVAPCILNIPVRLLPSTSSDGGFQYLEGLYALLSQSSEFEYWGKRFLSPMASLDRITLRFFTYSGIPIPLEKMVSYRQTLSDCHNCTNCPSISNPYISPLGLLNSRREISLIIRAECYHYVNVGLDQIQLIDKLLSRGDGGPGSEESNFNVRAFNYEDY
jgi:hypothetical protein